MRHLWERRKPRFDSATKHIAVSAAPTKAEMEAYTLPLGFMGITRQTRARSFLAENSLNNVRGSKLGSTTPTRFGQQSLLPLLSKRPIQKSQLAPTLHCGSA